MMYWYRLITGRQSILALPMYKLLLKDIHNVYNHKWIISVKYVLDDVGNTYIYGYHNVVRSLVPQCYDQLLMLGLMTNIYNQGILILTARLRFQVIKY